MCRFEHRSQAECTVYGKFGAAMKILKSLPILSRVWRYLPKSSLSAIAEPTSSMSSSATGRNCGSATGVLRQSSMSFSKLSFKAFIAISQPTFNICLLSLYPDTHPRARNSFLRRPILRHSVNCWRLRRVRSLLMSGRFLRPHRTAEPNFCHQQGRLR